MNVSFENKLATFAVNVLFIIHAEVLFPSIL